MRYRIHKKTGDRISELGFGSSYIPEADEKTGVAALEAAVQGGVNYFDMASGDISCFPYYAKALGSMRKDIPSAYYRRKHPEQALYAQTSPLSRWEIYAVRKILMQEMYYGACTQHKHEHVAVGTKQVRSVPKEEQIIVER